MVFYHLRNPKYALSRKLKRATRVPAISFTAGSAGRPRISNRNTGAVKEQSRFVTHFQINLFASVVTAIVKKRCATVGQNVDELTPEVVAFACVESLFWNVFY